MNVTAPMKVTMTPVMPGEVAPAGTTILPPQSPSTPMAQTVQAAAAANLEVARQGVEAATALTNQQTAEAQAAFNAALAKSNDAAAQLAQVQTAATAPPPPWSVTFTEKR
jgi:hypothetical protein